MRTLNRKFKYKGHTFNIKIEVIFKNDKERCHKITINDMGASNFYKTYEATENIDALDILEQHLKMAEDDMMKFVESRLTVEQEFVYYLNEFGFE